MWEIIGWIIWGIITLLAISWAYGCRVYFAQKSGFQIATGLQTFSWWIISLVFFVFPLNKLHILWVAPLAFWAARIIVYFPVPIITPVILFFTNIFLILILIGVKKLN
jgi:hypothetical protein